MKIVFVCILKLIFISTASSQTKAPCHVCEYGGINEFPKFEPTFSVADVPKRCELVTYGNYYFDYPQMDDVNMYKKDEEAIKSLIAAGIPVYTYVGYFNKQSWVTDLLVPKDPATYDKLICPLIQKVNELQLTGIILNIEDLYNGADLANKLKEFINKIKQQLPNLKFALNVNAPENYAQIPNNGLFDFSCTNSVIDLYMIDMNINQYKCTPELACDGTTITSQDKNKLSLELLSNAICQSAMDKSKIIACIVIFPLTPHQFDVYTPYSKYCEDPNTAKTENWCIEKSQKLYDIGAFMKKQNFAGIAMDWLEWDDIKLKCECDKFPVTNLIFDGWDGVPIKPCPKIV